MEQSIVIAGFGGQGVLLAGTILANAFMYNDKKVTWYPCYGAEMRGGAVNCEIVVSDEEVTSVHKKEADILIALNDLSFEKFINRVKSGGTLITNTSLIKEKRPKEGINYIFAPISDIAGKSGNIKTTNMVALGILSTICNNVNVEKLEQAIETALSPNKMHLKEINLKALMAGYNYKNFKQEK